MTMLLTPLALLMTMLQDLPIGQLPQLMLGCQLLHCPACKTHDL